MSATAAAEREDDRRCHGCRGRERGADAQLAPPLAARRQRGLRELGRQTGVQAGSHVARERLLAEPGELQAHGLQFLVRHVRLDARVIHVR
jgi:hypothetical protein